MLFANSIFEGFVKSNLIGQGIVIVQLLFSVAMFTVIIGKASELSALLKASRQFISDFRNCNGVLEHYLAHRYVAAYGLEQVYRVTCERVLGLLSSADRGELVASRGSAAVALTKRDVELVRGSCEHALDEAEIGARHGIGLVVTVVGLAPMLGLLGTVWGVLDAFFEMGSAGSANLATIAPSISSALVTTVVGLLIAIPGQMGFNFLHSRIRALTSEMEGFADELIASVGREFLGKDN